MPCADHGNPSYGEADRVGSNSLEDCNRLDTETSTPTNIWDHATAFLLIETAIPLGRRYEGFRGMLLDTEVGLNSKARDFISTPTLSQSATSSSNFSLSRLEFLMQDDSMGWSHNLAQLNDASASTGDIKMDFDTLDTNNTSTSPQTPLIPFHTINNLLNPNFNASNNSQDCMKLAISALQGFNDTSSTYNSFSGLTTPFPSQSIEFILEESKAAAELIHSIIQCPCSPKSHLVMLITVILSKILDRYQQISHSHNKNTKTTGFPGRRREFREIFVFLYLSFFSLRRDQRSGLAHIDRHISSWQSRERKNYYAACPQRTEQGC